MCKFYIIANLNYNVTGYFDPFCGAEFPEQHALYRSGYVIRAHFLIMKLFQCLKNLVSIFRFTIDKYLPISAVCYFIYFYSRT